MAWTTYTIHVKPGKLRDPERFEPGTVLRVVDYATGKQIPPEGAVVRVKSRDIELSWARNEAAGDVEITIAEEPTPWAEMLATRYRHAVVRATTRVKSPAKKRATKPAEQPQEDDEVTS